MLLSHPSLIMDSLNTNSLFSQMRLLCSLILFLRVRADFQQAGAGDVNVKTILVSEITS